MIHNVPVSLWRISRPWAWASVIMLAVGTRAIADMLSQPLAFALTLIILVLTTICAFASNDYFDRHVDRIIHPERVLPRGLLPPTFVLFTALLTSGSALFLAYRFQPSLFPYVLSANLLLLAYSPLKNLQGLLGNLIVGFVVALVVPYSASSLDFQVLALAAAMFLAMFGRELLKDIQDMKGEVGFRKTLPMQVGSATTYRLAAILLGLAFPSLVLALLMAERFWPLLTLALCIPWTARLLRSCWVAAQEDAITLVSSTRRVIMVVGVILAFLRVSG